MKIELKNAIHGYEDAVKNIKIIVLEELKKCNSEEYYQILLSDIKKQEIGYAICSNIQRNQFEVETFYYNGSISDFISNDRASKLIDIIKPIYLRELALYRLMVEGYLMPVGLQSESNRISINMHFTSEKIENLKVYVYFDMMPFGKYIKVSSNVEAIS